MSKLKTGGRKKGTPNKITKDIKKAYRILIENNLNNMENWINKVADTDPAKAISLILALSEYVVPKIARSDADLKDSEPPIIINFTETVRKDEDEQDEIM